MNPTPENPSESDDASVFVSLDVVDVLLEGPADTTRRPRQKNIPGAPPWWEEMFAEAKRQKDAKKTDGDQPRAP
jgi:hypothetical protein